jgi:alpha-tubulin suppressor-like RCC1 family protein
MGSTFGLAESYTGEIYSWGSNVSGQLGHGDCDTCTTIQKMPALPISSIEDIACGSHSVIAIGQTASDSSLQYLNGYQVHN